LNYVAIGEPIAQLIAIFVVRKLPRKYIMASDSLFLGIINCLIAVFLILDVKAVVCLLFVAQVFTYDGLGIPVLNIYAVEI
jgi:hypothetical protein